MKRLHISLLAISLSTVTGHSAILYSGEKNISITGDFTSVYIDVDNFSGSGSSTQETGWDIDAFFGGEAFGNSANFQPARTSFSSNSAILNLTTGSLVGSSLIYFNAEAGSSTHIGGNPDQFASGSEGFLGFTLVDNATNGPYYGWMRVNFSNTGDPGTIIDWAYDNSGSAITVGAVPEPSSLALLALGSSLLAIRRKR